MTPTLPQYDTDRAGRDAELQATRAEYNWDHDFLAPLPMLQERGTQHPDAWQADIGWDLGILPKDAHPPVRYIPERWLSLHGLRKNQADTRDIWSQRAFTSPQDYKKLFVAIPPPSAMAAWPDDAEFVAQRTAGMNPVVLERIDAVPRHFAVTDADLASLLPPGRSLADLSRAGQLFLSDYRVLEGIPLGAFGNGEKFVSAPLGLFWRDDAGRLGALAIQLDQNPSPQSVITPAAGRAWLLAKTYFQIADVNYHEMGTHLGRTHFILEGFAIAASRTLSARHPVAMLLRPHLRVLLWNNFEGRELLLSPNGFATQLMAGGLQGSSEIVKRSYAGVPIPPVAGIPRRDVPAWSFEDFDLPLSLKSRGVADPAVLPDFAYRDDGLLVWEAVRDYVSSYLRLYYASDADVVNDTEIQAFAAELASPAAGCVKGVSAPRAIDDLVTILTRIVFTCGPQHAAVNFPQYDMAGFAPSMPAAAYARPPQDPKTQPDAFHDAFLLQALPPPGQAELQIKTTLELTCYRFDKLGYYESGDFTDAGALAVIAAFQKRLASVTDTISARNAKRARPYPWFLPERITNSTSI